MTAATLDVEAQIVRDTAAAGFQAAGVPLPMLRACSAAYRVIEAGRQGPSDRGDPRTSVLGDDRHLDLYRVDQDALLRWCRYHFLGRGKPSTHVRVLSGLTHAALAADAPEELRALLDAIVMRLAPPPVGV